MVEDNYGHYTRIFKYLYIYISLKINGVLLSLIVKQYKNTGDDREAIETFGPLLLLAFLIRKGLLIHKS